MNNEIFLEFSTVYLPHKFTFYGNEFSKLIDYCRRNVLDIYRFQKQIIFSGWRKIKYLHIEYNLFRVKVQWDFNNIAMPATIIHQKKYQLYNKLKFFSANYYTLTAVGNGGLADCVSPWFSLIVNGSILCKSLQLVLKFDHRKICCFTNSHKEKKKVLSFTIFS